MKETALNIRVPRVFFNRVQELARERRLMTTTFARILLEERLEQIEAEREAVPA